MRVSPCCVACLLKPQGSIHEFTGLETPAVILTDVDLPKEYHRDLLCARASRAADRLVALEHVS